MTAQRAREGWRNRITGHGEESPDQLLANPLNFRSHPKPQQDALAGVLSEVGWVQDVIVNQRTGHVIDGHLRVSLAISREEPTIPVVYVDLDEHEEKLILATIDPISAMATTDAEKLDELLREVSTGDAAVQAMLSDLAESAGILGQQGNAAEDPGAEIDRAEELRQKWGCEVGQVWMLGDHRLMIGDSTDPDAVACLLSGDSVQLVATSPPYGDQRDYKSGPVDWASIVCPAITNAVPSLSADGSILVNLGLVHRDGRVIEYWRPLFDAMEQAGRPLFGWYVWDKLDGLVGDWNGRLAPAHEWVFHFADRPRRPSKTKDTKHGGVVPVVSGLRQQDGELSGWSHKGRAVQAHKIPDSVIRATPAKGGVEGHPAPFSVGFVAELIEPYSAVSEVVHEPFSGSGTTILVCEQLGRRCRAMEIAPAYAAVAIQRWVDATGREPSCENAR